MDSSTAGMAKERESVFDSAYMEAVCIAGIIMASLVALLILRIVVNFLIDVLILGDYRSLKRMANKIRRLIPWLHTRTEPEEQVISNTTIHRTVVELGPEVNRAQLKDNVENLLPQKILSNLDLERMRSGECSICLNEFEIGDKVVIEEHCSNTFHKKCLLNWIVQGPNVNTNCPHCRSQVISVDALSSVAV